MADAPNDYREPKVTAADKKSSGSIIPWILLALGILALLAWLLGAFDGDDDVAVVPAETVVEQPAVVETPAVTTETPAVTTETPAVTTETPAATTDAPAVVVPETDAAPNATDVETTTVPITPAEPAAPATND